jgi:hypothetical protein
VHLPVEPCSPFITSWPQQHHTTNACRPPTTNHRKFGDITMGEYGDEAMGMDLGMLGATGGKMRLPATKEQRGSECALWWGP